MAVVDATISVTEKIVEYFLPQIGRHLGYFVHYDRKIEKLRNKVRRLEMKRNEVQESVEEATRNGKVIKPAVEEWLRSVNNTITGANAILENEVRWFNVCSRYRSGKRAERKAEFIVELQCNGVFNRVWKHPPPLDIESMSTGDFVAFQSRDLDFHKVMEALKDDHINIIGISGMGGVGKTTLVTEVAIHAKRDQLFDMVLMVVVSQIPNEKGIQDQIANMLGLKFEESSSKQERAEILSRQLKQLMEQGKRILLILDDVWAELELADKGIPFAKSHKKLKIVLTTRRQHVCRVMDCQMQMWLQVLSEEDSWSLFRSNAGNFVDSPTLNDVARKVSRECGALPIALVTVGRALRNIEDLQEWEEALRELKHAAPINVEGVDEKVYACLKLSYDYLRSEEAKQIFLLCCLFPEDHDIEVETLVYYAVGKGTFQRIANSIEEIRNSLCTTINHLQASSLLLRGKRRECVKMHDVTRDVAISIASASEKDMLFVRASIGLKEWPRDVACEDFTAISLMCNEIEELPVGLKCPKLKILSLRGNKRLTTIPDTFFEGMTSLEVLDMFGVPFRVVPESIEFLKNLRVLIWRGSQSSVLSNISVFGKLRHLQMLDLRYNNNIREIPKEIRQLKNLRLLDLRDCALSIKIAPSAVSCLSRLEELYLDWDGNLGEEAVDWFDQLKLLSCLNILYVRILNHSNIGFSDIRFNLSKFQVSFGKVDFTCITLPLGRETPLMDGINAYLKQTYSLRVSQCSNSFRNFLFHLNENSIGFRCLKFLVLVNCLGIEHLINAVEPIENSRLSLCPHLERVHLFDMNDLKTICHGSLPATGCLWKLKIVKIRGCKRLLNVVASNLWKMFQHLKYLEVSKCDALEEVFDLNDHEHICSQEGDVFPLSSLTTLDLTNLPRLQTIWKGPTQNFQLHNLSKVYVSGCPRLRYLFSCDLSGTLLQLEYLNVIYCTELEEVVAWKIIVDKIVFPRLKVIRLRDLPSLLSFCSGTVPSKFPSLSRLSIEGCPNLKIFASGFQSTQDRIHFIREEGDIREDFYVQDPNIAIQNYLDMKKVETSTSECQSTPKLKAIEFSVHDSTEEEEGVSDHEQGNSGEGSSSVPQASAVIGGT